MTTLTWYGHACFQLDLGPGGSVIFDPYAPGSVPGAELPEGLRADQVLCSHSHGDHNAADRVTLTGREPDYALRFLDTYHDGEMGAKRGPNRISLVEYGGFRAAHLGDLGCPLTEEQIEALRGADLLLLPVGGFFTIGPEEAKALLDAVQPRVAVPMHYRRGEMGFPVLHTLEEFTGLFSKWTEVKGAVLNITEETSGLYVMNLC